jgi:hypothetical protein
MKRRQRNWVGRINKPGKKKRKKFIFTLTTTKKDGTNKIKYIHHSQ